MIISQGVYMKSSPPLPGPSLPLINSCNTATTSHELHHQLLAFCSTSPPQAPLPPPTSAAEPRRLAKAPHPTHILKCPRCASSDTKFCYYNNYSLSQPRYFCKNCKRYWTAGGILRNVPVGGGLRKNKRSKLKLAAEAEAAAAAAAGAARDLSAHHEGKPSYPVEANPMGSCSINAISSVVSGLPAKCAAGPAVLPSLPSSHTPTASDLPRTSSGSECSTIDYVGYENSNQLHHFCHGLPIYGVRPQSYTSCSAPSLASTSCNQQYSSSSGEEGGARSMGYDGTCSQSVIGMNTVAGSNPDLGNAPIASYGNGNHTNMEGEKAEINNLSSNSNYDWQGIAENLFQGEGFLHMPGGGWPDFSQFHDPTNLDER